MGDKYAFTQQGTRPDLTTTSSHLTPINQRVSPVKINSFSNPQMFSCYRVISTTCLLVPSGPFAQIINDIHPITFQVKEPHCCDYHREEFPVISDQFKPRKPYRDAGARAGRLAHQTWVLSSFFFCSQAKKKAIFFLMVYCLKLLGKVGST